MSTTQRRGRGGTSRKSATQNLKDEKRAGLGRQSNGAPPPSSHSAGYSRPRPARRTAPDPKTIAETYMQKKPKRETGRIRSSTIDRQNRMIENELNLENVQHSQGNGKNDSLGSPRSGKQLWNVVKKKPVTLSQKLRALENAVKVLQSRLEEHDLPTDVDGEDPVPPSDEIKKLKEKLSHVKEEASMANQHKRAAEEYEKQARDAKALLEKIRAAGKLKAKELELSAEAGAMARKNLADAKLSLSKKNAVLEEEKKARTEAERSLAEAQHGLELLRKQLDSLMSDKSAIEASCKELREQVQRQSKRVETLEQDKKDLLSQIESLHNGTTDSEKLIALESQIKSSREEHDRLKKRLAEQEVKLKRIEELEQILSDATKKHEIIVADLAKKTAECTSLSEKLAQFKTDSKVESATIRELQDSNAKLSEKLKKIEYVYKSEQELKQQLQKQVDKATQNYSAAVDELEQTRNDADQLKKTIERLEEEGLSVESSLKKCKAEKKTMEDMVGELKTKIITLEKQLVETQKFETSGKQQSNKDKANELQLSLRAKQAEDTSAKVAEEILTTRKELTESEMKRQQLQSRLREVTAVVDSLKKINGADKQEIHNLKEQIKFDKKSRDNLEMNLRTALDDFEALKKSIGEQDEQNGEFNKDFKRLKKLNESLRKQLQEANAAHRLIAKQLEDESVKSLKSLQEKEKSSLDAKAMIDDLKQRLVVERQKLQQTSNDVQMLEGTIETLTNQLSSLVESGECFEANAQRREEHLAAQIKRLRHGRESDREAYKTAVEACDVWRIRAENAEEKIAELLLEKSHIDRKRKIIKSGSSRGGSLSKNCPTRPTPPTSQHDANRINKKHRAANQDLSRTDVRGASERRREQARYAEQMMKKLGVGNAQSLGNKTRLPPVSSASPATKKRSRESEAVVASVANLDHALANMLETPA